MPLNGRTIRGSHPEFIVLDRYTIQDPATGRIFPRVAGGDGPVDLNDLVERAETFQAELDAAAAEDPPRPPDVTGWDAEQLATLRDELAERFAAARAQVETDEQVEALETVGAAIQSCDAALAAVEADEDAREAAELEAAEAREARLAALDALVSPQATGTGDGEGDGGEGEGGEAGAGEAGEGGEQAPPEGGEGAGEPEANGTTEEGRRAASSVRGRRASLALLGTGPRQGLHPSEADGTPPQPGYTAPLELRGRVTASAGLAEVTAGTVFSSAQQLGDTIQRLHGDLQVENPTRAKHYLGRRRLDRPHSVELPLSGPADGVLDRATALNIERKRAAAAATLAADTMQGSGGVCVPDLPDLTITVVGGERGPAWVDRLPSVTGNRPTAFFPWINMSLTAGAGTTLGARPVGGFDTVTAAQDLAGYGDAEAEGGSTIPVGGHQFKDDCIELECPALVNEKPEGNYRCVKYGNFMAITWQDWINVFDRMVGFWFDVRRDEKYLAKFVAQAKNLSLVGPQFGVVRDLLDAFRRLVAHLRSVRSAPNMAFTFTVPGFARYMIAQDLANAWAGTEQGVSRISPANALALLALDEGIFIEEYNVSIGATAGGSPTVLPELADGAALPDWPAQIRVLVHPEGGVMHHDYGELAFGLRETMMGTNDFAGFYETFESVFFRTTDLFTIDINLCVSGTSGGMLVKDCTP